MNKFLVVKGLRAPRINASNHVQVGLPSPGAFYGLAYCITRAINALEQQERPHTADLARLDSVAIAVTSFSFVNARKKFMPLHDDDKPATPMGMVDDLMGDVAFSLVLNLEFEGDGAFPDLKTLKTLVGSQRFAGSYLDASLLKIWVENDKGSALRRLRGRAFLLRDLSSQISARVAEGTPLLQLFEETLVPVFESEHDAAASNNAATLPAESAPASGPDETDEAALLFDMPLEEEGNAAAILDSTNTYEGWTVPTLIGYRLLEVPHARAGARQGHAHAFAEPMVGLLRAQLVGSVLIEQSTKGPWPEVFFRPRECGDLLVYSALSDAAFATITASIKPE